MLTARTQRVTWGNDLLNKKTRDTEMGFEKKMKIWNTVHEWSAINILALVLQSWNEYYFKNKTG